MSRKRHLQLCLAFYSPRQRSAPTIIAPAAALVAAVVQRYQQLPRSRGSSAQAELQTAGHVYYVGPRVDLGDAQPVPLSRLQQLLAAAMADWPLLTEEQAALHEALRRYYLATWYLVDKQCWRSFACVD